MTSARVLVVAPTPDAVRPGRDPRAYRRVPRDAYERLPVRESSLNHYQALGPQGRSRVLPPYWTSPAVSPSVLPHWTRGSIAVAPL